MICAIIEMTLQFIMLNEKQPISAGCICMIPLICHSLIQISGCQELGMGVGAGKGGGCGYEVGESTGLLPSVLSLQLPMNL